jgi:hypothetical protein
MDLMTKLAQFVMAAPLLQILNSRGSYGALAYVPMNVFLRFFLRIIFVAEFSDVASI